MTRTNTYVLMQVLEDNSLAPVVAAGRHAQRVDLIKWLRKDSNVTALLEQAEDPILMIVRVEDAIIKLGQSQIVTRQEIPAKYELSGESNVED